MNYIADYTIVILLLLLIAEILSSLGNMKRCNVENYLKYYMFIRQLMIQYGNIYNIEYNIDTMYRNSMQYFP